MNKAYVVAGVVGLGLVGLGLGIRRGQVPAEKRVSEAANGGVAANVPTHTNKPETEQSKTTLLQLLSAYQSDLRKWQSVADQTMVDMQRIEGAGNPACDSYAKDPVWGYHCNGFPICGINEWWSIDSYSRNQPAAGQCRNYVMGLGTLAAKRPLEDKAGFDKAKLEALYQEQAQGYQSAGELQAQYQAQKKRYEEAMTVVDDLKKKISDLYAQGVY